MSDEEILKHRTAEVNLTVCNAAGKPVPSASVTVQQVRHKFLFGCNAYAVGTFKDSTQEEGYRRRFADLLNYATLPFYWGRYEQAPGAIDEGRVRAMAKWLTSRGIICKGHPLVWHEVPCDWLEGRPLNEVKALQLARIGREVRAFAGLIDRWDVVNEAVVMPRFKVGKAVSRLCASIGRIELIRQAFAAAREAGPKTMLVLNDYDTSPAYELLIEECLAAGVDFDVIGIQSHMHKGYWKPDATLDVLAQRFSRFGKPLHFTELTILSGPLKTDNDWHAPHPGWDTTPEGEQLQAEQAEEFYRLLFACPAVEAITWWDFSDAAAWQTAPSGLVRKDMSSKPAYERLMKLVKGEWWTGPRTLVADAAGQVSFQGFLGDYTADAEIGGRSMRATFKLDRPGTAGLSVNLA